MSGKFMNTHSERKIEKILISSGLIMAALIIGYNLFYEPQVSPVIENSGKIVSDKYQKEKSKESHSKMLININTASKEEMIENLNGVGPALAERIIDYRETNGGFYSKEELMNVRGIGEKMFERLKDNITVK